LRVPADHESDPSYRFLLDVRSGISLQVAYNTRPATPTALVDDRKACATAAAFPFLTTLAPQLGATANDADWIDQSRLVGHFALWPASASSGVNRCTYRLDGDVIDLDTALNEQLLDVPIRQAVPQIERTATTITSAGNRKPAKAETEGDSRRVRENNFTGTSCRSPSTIAQRNSPLTEPSCLDRDQPMRRCLEHFRQTPGRRPSQRDRARPRGGSGAPRQPGRADHQ
jgi:hypothetical protein